MPPSPATEKVMFMLYRELPTEGRYRVVYFTELDEHNKEKEIHDAMRGESIFDGFIRSRGKEEAKSVVSAILDRLNNGESVPKADIARQLKPYLA